MESIDLTCLRLEPHNFSLGSAHEFYYCIDDIRDHVNIYKLTNKGLDRSLDKIMVKYHHRTMLIKNNDINDIATALSELGYAPAKQYLRQHKIDGLLS